MPLQNLTRSFSVPGSGPHTPVKYARMEAPPSGYRGLGRYPTEEGIDDDINIVRADLRRINAGMPETGLDALTELARASNPKKTVAVYFFTRRQQHHVSENMSVAAARAALGVPANAETEASAAGGRIHSHHHLVELKVTAPCALGIMAGVYDFPVLFALCMAKVTATDMAVLNEKLGSRKPIYSIECARALVQGAALRAVIDPVHSGPFVRNAHNLVAAYLAAQKSNSITKRNSKQFFAELVQLTAPDELREPGQLTAEDVEQASAYAGALAGLCLVSVMRFGKSHDEKAQDHKNAFIALIGCAASAIGGAPFPGAGAVSGMLTLAAEPLASHIFKKVELDETLIAVGGDLEAVMRRGIRPRQNFDPRVYTEVFQETIHRCGFAF